MFRYAVSRLWTVMYLRATTLFRSDGWRFYFNDFFGEAAKRRGFYRDADFGKDKTSRSTCVPNCIYLTSILRGAVVRKFKMISINILSAP